MAPDELRHPPTSVAFRNDIEGLRAIAVLLVVAFHAGSSVFGGGFVGVDVFFVLSGFLITRLLLSEYRATGEISLSAFWSRRARRLLPASLLVLASVLAMSALSAEPVTQLRHASEALAASLFVANYWFMRQATDYFAVELQPSPVLHFWSLSVEEQYYLLWPVILVLLFRASNRRGLTQSASVRLVALCLSIIGSLSLLAWIYATLHEPTVAHYAAPTRIWELAVGGLLAIPSERAARAAAPVPRSTYTLLSWLGLVLVIGASLRHATDLGYRFLPLPTVLGSALIIWSGERAGKLSTASALGLPLLRWIGRVSYGWYLWHWPVLIFGRDIFGSDPWTVVGLLVASLALAWATFVGIENPIRNSRFLRERALFSVGLGTAAIVALACGTAALHYRARLTLAQEVLEEYAGLRPSPIWARNDITKAHSSGCMASYGDKWPIHCKHGSIGAKEHWVLWGDSHAVQWFPAFEPLARKLGVELNVYGKAACAPGLALLHLEALERPYHECVDWNLQVLNAVTELGASAVVILHSLNDYAVYGEENVRMDQESSRMLMGEARRNLIVQLQNAGARVVFLRDTPTASHDVRRCVAENLDDPSVCDFERPAASTGISAEERELRALEGVLLLDLNDEVCTSTVCPAVADGILRWRDATHLTATYAATLQAPLERRLLPLLRGRNPDGGVDDQVAAPQ